jgi:hypothetical protein
MHPSTKILLYLGGVTVVGYAGWRLHDYAQAKKFRERRLAREQREAAAS